MRYKAICCAILICGIASTTHAQETKTFPEAQCSYTLQGEDWKWSDPKVLQQQFTDATTAAVAIKTTELVFTIRFNTPKQAPRDYRKYFESFEFGLMQSGRITKRKDGKHITFKGLSAYQINARTISNGQESAIRIFFANDILYQVSVISLGKLGSDEEIEPVFQGFNFLTQPKLSAPPTERELSPEGLAAEEGKAAAPCVSVGVLIIGGIIIFVVIRNQNKMKEERRRRRRLKRDEEEDDEGPPRRRSRPNRDEEEDDEGPSRRRSRPNRDEEEDDEGPPRRRSRPNRDEEEDDEGPPRRRRPKRDE